jgi:pyrroline-5-carboxylate reductase
MLERLGFIGTGSITEAIIDGLAAASSQPAEVLVSPRNAEIAARLAERHSFVRVAADNQQVLDRCDVVCLAVRPQIAQEVIASLRFSERHHVLSFIATFRLNRLQGLLPGVARITRLAPLPMVARKLGTTIVHPKDPVAAQLFNSVGMALESDDEADFDVLFAATALMGSFFTMLHTQAQWLQAKGIDQAVARSYLASLYLGLSATAKETDTPFDELAREFSTRGGLNEQVTQDLAGSGAFQAHALALDRVLQRIVKQ